MKTIAYALGTMKTWAFYGADDLVHRLKLSNTRPGRAICDAFDRYLGVDDEFDEPVPFAEEALADFRAGAGAFGFDDEDDDEDDMCPNCCTPWKCNGPHIPRELR